jgi:hypothetical protein
MQLRDLLGQRFGRLVVVKQATSSPKGARWLCRCRCGNTREIAASNLKRQRSCGCLAREKSSKRNATHHMSRSPTYRSWCGMIQRCENPRAEGYELYGGAGIRVCKRWRESFEAFLADMGERPTGKSIDRFPKRNGNYEPGNCRWATPSEQAQNRSNSFSEEQVADIYRRFDAGELRSKIAVSIGCTTTMISRVINRRTK